MKEFQQRVVEEKAELDKKLTKLRAFFETESYIGLDWEEQDRLQRQVGFMKSYSDVLAERIEEFK
jgi:hypothetical protein